MAIAFDAASTWTSGNPTTSITFNHTVGAGNNRILFVLALTTNNDVTATYAGAALTQVHQVQGVGADNRYLTILAKVAPASGANNIVISTVSNALIQGAGASYSGASQTTVADNTTSQVITTNVTSITQTLTPVADNCWLLMGARFGNPTIAAGAGATLRTGSTFTGILDSNGAISPPASTSMTATESGSGNTAYALMISFAPAVDGPPEWYMSLI